MQDRGFRKLAYVSGHNFKYFVNNNARVCAHTKTQIKVRKGSINASGQRSKPK